MTEERISVELRASPWLRAILMAAHVIAGGALALLPIPVWVLSCAWLALATSAWLALTRTGKGIAGSSFNITADGTCRWHQAAQTVSGNLRSDTTALPVLIVIRFNQADTRVVRSLVLLPDAMAADDWRRLQVFLRWGVRFGGAASTPSAGPS